MMCERHFEMILEPWCHIEGNMRRIGLVRTEQYVSQVHVLCGTEASQISWIYCLQQSASLDLHHEES